MKITELSSDLLHKYNVQGPRYTSYPPAPSWNENIGPLDYEKKIEEGNKKSAPLSLYLHLPFCEKLCYFCGCTTVITGKKRTWEKPYLENLFKEISWLGKRVNSKRKVVQFHLGGGTPTYHSPALLKEIMDTVKDNFSFDENAEVGTEVDPRVTSFEHLDVMQATGFNRLSMGVQDFNPDVQKAINRIQPYEKTNSLVEAARKRGFNSINIDLIYGLPYQTPATFKKTIGQILKINPDRMAVYSYAHVPWLKKHQQFLEAHLPQEQEKYEIFLMGLRKFTDAGYDYIGMDHFARSTDELSIARQKRTLWRNFQGYTTKSGTDLFGLGMSAIGKVQDAFFQNKKELNDYNESIEAGHAATVRGFILNADDKVRSRVIQNLLCHAEVVKSEIEQEFQIKFDQYFSESLNKLKSAEKDGLVELRETTIRPTDVGRIFLRNLAMAFDAYLPKAGEKQVFSRTV